MKNNKLFATVVLVLALFAASTQPAVSQSITRSRNWVTSALLFSVDGAFDIGAAAASRPANIWVTNQVSAAAFAPLNTTAGKYAWGNGNAALSNAAASLVGGSFGTTPSITGAASSFRVTLGTPVGQTGTINFNLAVAFGSAPNVVCRDETTAAANPPAYVVTTTQVALTFTTAVAADKIGCIVIGLP